jgi:hypothetical protein
MGGEFMTKNKLTGTDVAIPGLICAGLVTLALAFPAHSTVLNGIILGLYGILCSVVIERME